MGQDPRARTALANSRAGLDPGLSLTMTQLHAHRALMRSSGGVSCGMSSRNSSRDTSRGTSRGGTPMGNTEKCADVHLLDLVSSCPVRLRSLARGRRGAVVTFWKTDRVTAGAGVSADT